MEKMNGYEMKLSTERNALWYIHL